MSFEDIRALAHPVLRHRVLTNFHAESEGITSDSIIDQLLEAVPTPGVGHVAVSEQRVMGLTIRSAAMARARGEGPHATKNGTHSLPGARFVDPKVLARIGNLELLAKTVVDGFINGLHRSPYFGASVDFAEHRGYMPGDDIRRVDWKLYARTDRYYLKEYEADTNTNFSVILDVSRSMNFASNGISKLDYGKYLCACLAYFAQKQRDRIGCVTFDNDIVDAHSAVGEAPGPRAAHARSREARATEAT